MKKTWKKIAVVSLTATLLTASLASCDSNSNSSSIDLENPTIDVMTQAFSAESASENSPVVKKLEEVVGANLNFIWTPSTSYDEKVTTTMGSGTYPHIMLISTINSSVVRAVKDDTFWDLTDKLTDSEKFPNLAQTDPDINHNISFDGRVYGVYRARELGRSGVTIREDWLENLGLEIPTTIDEFYSVLKQFKENDPDRNGVDDTYGMIVTDYLTGPLDNLAIWFGAPNQWGLDENGELAPDFTFQGYKDALDFMRKCYSEGLINQNMATYSADKWNEEFLSGHAGVIIDVADRSRRIAQNMPEAKINVFGYVKKDDGAEPRTLPTKGHGGFFAIPKTSVKTEEELDLVLNVLDKVSGKEGNDLVNYGIEGRNYVVEDGMAVKNNDPALVKEYADLNQFGTGIVDFGKNALKTKYDTPMAYRVDEVFADNKKYVITNPAEPYQSDTYAKSGPQLDAILEEADVKYICGQIDEAGWLAEVERWKTMGGNKVIEEINEAYKNDPSIQH